MSRKQSEMRKELWQDPDYRKKQFAARGMEYPEITNDPLCKFKGECFARRNNRCTILRSAPTKRCSFQKPTRGEIRHD